MLGDARYTRDGEPPLYIRIADSVRARIGGGEFREGDKLPSVRALSDELGVNPATVVSAYRILADEGLLEARAGSGAYVAFGFAPGSARFAPERRLPDAAVDLASNTPPRSLYPLDEIKRFLVEAVDVDGGRAFEYQDPAGYRPLREAIAALSRGPGAVPADDIHVCSGAQQGLDLVARVILRPGDVAAVEEPGYQGAVEAFLAAGARVAPLRVGPGGPDLDALERLAGSKPLRLVYVNPDFQNPTGALYRPEDRERLADLADRLGFYVVEDSQMSDLAFDGSTPPPVESFDRAGRVLFVKSYSKSIMPGLRIAYLKAPAAFRPRIEGAKRTMDHSGNGLLQRVLERYLSSGCYAAHLPRARARYRELARALTGALRGSGQAGLEWSEPAGGLNLWLGLPAGVDPDDFERGLADEGYALTSGSVFMLKAARGTIAAGRGYARVCYGQADEPALRAAAAAIARRASALE